MRICHCHESSCRDSKMFSVILKSFIIFNEIGSSFRRYVLRRGSLIRHERGYDSQLVKSKNYDRRCSMFDCAWNGNEVVKGYPLAYPAMVHGKRGPWELVRG